MEADVGDGFPHQAHVVPGVSAVRAHEESGAVRTGDDFPRIPGIDGDELPGNEGDGGRVHFYIRVGDGPRFTHILAAEQGSSLGGRGQQEHFVPGKRHGTDGFDAPGQCEGLAGVGSVFAFQQVRPGTVARHRQIRGEQGIADDFSGRHGGGYLVRLEFDGFDGDSVHGGGGRCPCPCPEWS